MAQQILERIEAQERVQERRPGGGLLSVDRGLPFLIVYREPAGRADPGTAWLISGESAFLVSRAEGDEDRRLVRELSESGSRTHGAYLVLELWSSPDPHSETFVVHAPDGPAPEVVERLVDELSALQHLSPGLQTRLEYGDERSPPGMAPLLSVEESWQTEVLVLGLEVPPIYRDAETGVVFPRFLRALQREVSGGLRRALYEFVRVQSTTHITNPLALGTRTLSPAVFEIDEALCAIERSADLLLLTSPINSEAAWAEFRANGFQKNPEFHYRLLPVDPDLLKRRLFALRLEEVADPAMADLLEDKRRELDIHFSMLRERDTPGFRYNSQRLYGTVDDRLARTARELLDSVSLPPHSRSRPVDAHGFLRAAHEELDFYRQQYPELETSVQIRRDIDGLMVSTGTLMIGDSLSIDPSRLEPLIHHEVGTHVLTYVNGEAQPLGQLRLGLAGYDELQEGLAVLSEYLVGGLNALRLRLLAARVLAAQSVEEGGEFVDTFRLLTRELGYSEPGAWHITLRVHASGGFTRDLIYLRGLIELLEMLEAGVELRDLYVGKIARKHVPIIEELRYRGVLREPPLTPRFFQMPDALARLERVRRGITLSEMI